MIKHIMKTDEKGKKAREVASMKHCFEFFFECLTSPTFTQTKKEWINLI